MGLKALTPWLVAGYAASNLAASWPWIRQDGVSSEGADGRVGSTTDEPAPGADVEEDGIGEGGRDQPSQKKGSHPPCLTCCSASARRVPHGPPTAPVVLVQSGPKSGGGWHRRRSQHLTYKEVAEEAKRHEWSVLTELYQQAMEWLSQEVEATCCCRGAQGKAPTYRLCREEAAREAFGGTNRVLLSLWKTCWRAYHGILQMGDTQTWLLPGSHSSSWHAQSTQGHYGPFCG